MNLFLALAKPARGADLAGCDDTIDGRMRRLAAVGRPRAPTAHRERRRRTLTVRQGSHLTDSTTLASASTGRDNNLNLMRVVAATLVLLSHSFTLATGDSSTEPGRAHLGLTFGDFAVDIFFVMSGFLVTRSLSRSRSLARYGLSRAFRILPGLWVALAISTAVVCVAFSDMSPMDNLRAPEVWRYMLKNAVVVAGPVFGFPGAFPDNPYHGSVNASLWTLPLEAWMYITLAATWALAARLAGTRSGDFHRFVRIIAGLTTLGAIGLVGIGHPSNSLRHACMFYLAAALYGWQDRVRLRGVVAGALLAAIVGAAFLPHLFFEAAYRLLLPYLVFYLAFVPGGLVRRYNRIGDYSYGMYIYAFPVQQMCVACVPGISVGSLLTLSAVLTLLCAMLSWHLVESPAMRWHERRTRRLVPA
jgi:peptidoglycan/LPS O-acetylase OafA/YrhL